jgi:HPt (histidine-containing phosphotransfer) domain-containing protein
MVREYFGDDGAGETLRLYLDTLKGDIADLAATIKARDATDAAIRAHRIRGAAKYVGAATLEDVSAALERACGPGDWPTIEAEMTRLLSASVEVEAEVARALAAIGDADRDDSKLKRAARG